MFCKQCGATLPEGSSFCPGCGATTAPQQPTEEPIVYPPYTPVPAESTTPILVLGIVAAALSEMGLPGIIVGAIGKKKAKAYFAAGGARTGKAKAGAILSKVGLIVGIVMTVVYVFAGIIGAAIGYTLGEAFGDTLFDLLASYPF